jgi:tricorn protease-like protein
MLNKKAKAVAVSLTALALLQILSGCVAKPQHNRRLTVELIYGSQELLGKDVIGVQWTLDGEGFTYYQPDPQTGRPCVWKYDLGTRKKEKLLDSKNIEVLEQPESEKRFTLSNYFWSPSGKAILLSSASDLYLYNVTNESVRRLTYDEEIERDPQFSPVDAKSPS